MDSSLGTTLEVDHYGLGKTRADTLSAGRSEILPVSLEIYGLGQEFHSEACAGKGYANEPETGEDKGSYPPRYVLDFRSRQDVPVAQSYEKPA